MSRNNPNFVFQMLRDLGIARTSISEAHAASVYDAVLRNAMPDMERSRECTQQQIADKGGRASGIAYTTGRIGKNVVELGRKEELRLQLPDFKRDRLCWSMFLEAMVSALRRV